MSIYERALSDLPVERLKAAFHHCLLNIPRFPSIADVRQAAGADQRALVNSEKFEAEKALDQLDRDISTHGADRWAVMRNGELHPAPLYSGAMEYALRQIGGWRAYAERTIQQEPFMRRDFLAAHARYSETGAFLAPTRQEAKALLEQLQVGQIEGES